MLALWVVTPHHVAPNIKLFFLKRFNDTNAILENIFLILLSDILGLVETMQKSFAVALIYKYCNVHLWKGKALHSKIWKIYFCPPTIPHEKMRGTSSGGFTFCVLVVLAALTRQTQSVPFIVQSLSSNYALVLGGYGPGYQELRNVEVVKHDKVCPNVIK